MDGTIGTLGPMRVERVETRSGSRIVPPLDQEWADLDKLAWNAGVALVDSGIRLMVAQVGRHEFAVMAMSPTVSWGGAHVSFSRAWRHINDLSQGAAILREQMKEGD